MESDNFKSHAEKVAGTLSKAVENLTSLDMLVPILKQLGQSHVARNVQKEHYPIVGQAILNTLAGALGEQWTPVVKKAWTIVIDTVAQTMISDNYDEKAMDDIMNDVMGSQNLNDGSQNNGNIEKQNTQWTEAQQSIRNEDTLRPMVEEQSVYDVQDVGGGGNDLQSNAEASA